MKESQLIKVNCKIAVREFVKYRKVIQTEPLQILEMDIKLVWGEQYKRHAFILSVIDTLQELF